MRDEETGMAAMTSAGSAMTVAAPPPTASDRRAPPRPVLARPADIVRVRHPRCRPDPDHRRAGAAAVRRLRGVGLQHLRRPQAAPGPPAARRRPWQQGQDPLHGRGPAEPADRQAGGAAGRRGLRQPLHPAVRQGLRQDRSCRAPTTQTWNEGPGHYTNSQLPGQIGNFALAGHRVGKGEPFLNLDQLRPRRQRRRADRQQLVRLHRAGRRPRLRGRRAAHRLGPLGRGLAALRRPEQPGRAGPRDRLAGAVQVIAPVPDHPDAHADPGAADPDHLPSEVHRQPADDRARRAVRAVPSRHRAARRNCPEGRCRCTSGSGATCPAPRRCGAAGAAAGRGVRAAAVRGLSVGRAAAAGQPDHEQQSPMTVASNAKSSGTGRG